MGLNHKFLSILICLQLCLLVVVIYLGSRGSKNNKAATLPSRTTIKSTFKPKIEPNYFSNASKLLDLDLLINTTNCHIPALSPWDEEVMPFLKEARVEKNCADNYKNWSHIDGETLVLEVEKMSKSKLPFGKKLSCCYKTIQRAGVKSKNRDWVVSVSKCISINSTRTKMTSEFIALECYLLKGNKTETDPTYRAWHGIATAENNERQELIKKKLQFWEKRKEKKNDRPPNIVVIGHDSTSRLSFRRQMPSTLTFLEDLGAVEMLGYTRVGESTYPNFCSILTGYSYIDYEKLCVTKPMTMTEDDCPFVWKRFDAANYLTAHIEDEPNCAIFHYRKHGFSSQQVDFVSRPLFLEATKQYQTDEWKKKAKKNSKEKLVFKFSAPCINHQTNDQAMLSYLQSVMDFSENKSVPVFSILFATYATHGDFNGLKVSDDVYASFLQKMKNKGRLDNTILIVMGDHGVRFGSAKKTLVGSYEENLPNLWIYLPKTIRKKFPKWQDALKINSKRLTSPFSFYWSLNHILDTFTKTPPPTDAVIPPSKSNKTSKVLKGTTLRRKYQLPGFFRLVSEKDSCSDVGVPNAFCSCNSKHSISLKDQLLAKATAAAVRRMNYDLRVGGENCMKVKLEKITAGAMVDLNGKASSPKKGQIVVGFITTPGMFSMEAVVDYEVSNGKMLGVSHLQRTDEINQSHVWCISDSHLELICFCKNKVN